jgi:ribonuclease P protein component
MTMTDVAASQAFGRSRRILTAKDYAAVMRSRTRFSGGLFVGHLRLREDTSQWRLGLVVPKKFEPNAVRRNALKRVWRDLFRRELGSLEELNAGHDLVIRLFARPRAQGLTPLRKLCRAEAQGLLTQIRGRLA